MALISQGHTLAGATKVLESQTNRVCTVLQNQTGADVYVAAVENGGTYAQANALVLADGAILSFPTPIGQELWAEGTGNLVVLTNVQV